ncbi:MAG: hypothetical protein KC443_15220 [Anaerolineales bacterium]|nr:hypothetical protein [Anaerolineales bacterium]
MDAKTRERLLREDVGDEATDELQALLAQVDQWPLPTPTPLETEQLLAQLLPELPSQSGWRRWRTRLASWWLWQLLRAQVRVVRSEIWTASALVMILGVFVSFVMVQEGRIGGPLALVAPLVAATGIAFLYNPADERVWEMERVTAVSPRLILLVRLLLVFGYDLLLGVLGSLLLTLLLPDLTLWSVVTLWLAPMTFLAAFAFCLSVLTGLPELGMLISMIIWMMQQVRALDRLLPLMHAWPDLTAVSTQPWLFALSIFILAFALWQSDRAERWL